jgi:hypothetical protein
VHKIKESEYCYKNNTILVKDKIGIFSGQEEVFLNGERIAFHSSKIFSFKKYDFVLIDEKVLGLNDEEFQLKVICGLHLNIIPRTHIYLNGVLVGGDVTKPLYIPPCPWSCIMIALSMIGLLEILFDDVPSVYRYFSNSYEIREKVMSNSPDLWQKEIVKMLFNSNSEIREQKKKEWTQLCEMKNDHHCRLSSYIYTIEGDVQNRIKYALKACHHNFPLSCFQAYESHLFSVGHPDYNYVTANLTSYCIKDEIYNERKKSVCYEFSKKYFKESGDEKTFKLISKILCAQRHDQGCYNFQAINGEIIKYK